MSFYLDTSVLVAALTTEPETARIQRWMRESEGENRLAISDWVSTEFAGAVGLKLRTGQINQATWTSASAKFVELAKTGFLLWAIERDHFRRAADYLRYPSLNLRAPDALHLAVAAGYGARLCTLDRRMADAGAALGVLSVLI